MIFSNRFKGRTAIITGGASGLGKAVAARICSEGGSVVLWDLNATLLEAAALETGAKGVVAVDVSTQKMLLKLPLHQWCYLEK